MIIRGRVLAFLFCFALIGTHAFAQLLPRRRALLIGIDDYSASRLGPRRGAISSDRDWPNLAGAVNDVRAMHDLLIKLKGFDPRDIVTLTNQQATRDSIFNALESQIRQPIVSGDLLLVYYAGHGSQVDNSLSDEPDKRDESIIPADSKLGAADIRDKELRRFFNRILDRGIRLTVILDSCHSGSGARGLDSGAGVRGIKPDLRDIADGSDPGPRPENRGALVIAATADSDVAHETHDEQGNFRGTFSWAWARAMRKAASDEPAMRTFLRAQAYMRAETPYQEPVLAGDSDSRNSPFLGVAPASRSIERASIVVEMVRPDGTVVLQGGWADGLTVGSELRPIAANTERYQVTAILGVTECEARSDTPSRAIVKAPQSGTFMEVVSWAPPPRAPLRIWMPETHESASTLAGEAKALADIALRRGVRWIDDPIDSTPNYLLRWRDREWEMLAPGATARHLDSAAARQAMRELPRKARLFVQLPIAAALGEKIAGDDETEGVTRTSNPTEADYILVGRQSQRGLEYAWVRPSVTKSDQRKTALPLRTTWHRDGNLVEALRDDLLRLRKIRGWQLLDSPPQASWPYHLTIEAAHHEQPLRSAITRGGEAYGFVLHGEPGRTIPTASRFVYVFSIDSFGRSVLLFPQSGSVENHFPLPAEPGQSTTPPPVIPLGPPALFEAAPPYGVDTYFLLTSDQPLPNPWILEWDGVRARRMDDPTPLEELLTATSTSGRAARAIPISSWSIEKLACESIPPRKKSH